MKSGHQLQLKIFTKFHVALLTEEVLSVEISAQILILSMAERVRIEVGANY